MTINVRYEKNNLFFESIVIWFFSPIQNLITSTTSSISGLLDHYFFLAQASKENDRLLLKVDLLSKKNNELIERNKLLERSDNLIEFLDDERPFVIAKVVGYDPTQWSKVIFINRGTDHKVKKNLSVINNAGVIGHVIHSSPKSSKVLLITDSRSAVDSLFQETRESGITVGTGEDICEMKFVPISAKVSVGDKVISSGLGGVFPKGLVVGKVVDVVKQSQELFQDIMVAPSADLSNIEEVIVLLSDQVHK